MLTITHEDVRDARPMPPRLAPATRRSFGERAVRMARTVLAYILLGTIAVGTIIAVRIGLYALGHPDHPLYRLFN